MRRHCHPRHVACLLHPELPTPRWLVCLPANGRRRYTYATDCRYRPTRAVELDADPAVELDVVGDVLDPRSAAPGIWIHLRRLGGYGRAEGDASPVTCRRAPGEHVGNDDFSVQPAVPFRSRLLPHGAADVVVGCGPDGLVLLARHGPIRVCAAGLDRERDSGLCPDAVEREQ